MLALNVGGNDAHLGELTDRLRYQLRSNATRKGGGTRSVCSTKPLKGYQLRLHRAGEKLFIDYAGPTIGLTDGTHTHNLVAVLDVFWLHLRLRQATRDDSRLDRIAGARRPSCARVHPRAFLQG